MNFNGCYSRNKKFTCITESQNTLTMTDDRIDESIIELGKESSWSNHIPLPNGKWTFDKDTFKHTRLKRIAQVLKDVLNKPMNESRILDLGSLDGLFPLEFAFQGSETVGVEVRESNYQKAQFCKEAWNLDHLTYHQMNALDISPEKMGYFDAIVCSGLLYHLTANDSYKLLQKMYSMATRVVVIDTHISLIKERKFELDGDEYWGKYHEEHKANDDLERREKRIWASYKNDVSFWFTRPSLLNLLRKSGFSSVYECYNPGHLNFGKPGIEHNDRCTFVCIKGEEVVLKSSPATNNFHERWPEDSLSFHKSNRTAKAKESNSNSLVEKIKCRLSRILK